MGFLEAIISGIIQGITEFLPISSSGHLVILHSLFGLNKPQILFDIFLHAGTLLSIFIVFWNDIFEVLASKKRILLYILISTFITGIFVMVFDRKIESAFSSPNFVGLMLILTGVWLILGNFIRFSTGPLTAVKALFIGFAQGIAAFPGISRSGSTISTGLFLGLDGRAAARFSFLIAIPAIIGAFLLKLKDGLSGDININYFIGLFISCIIGVLSLKLLLKVLYGNKFHLFGIYCILAGILVVIFL